MSKLQSLIERLEEAEGPDRETDALIAIECFSNKYVRCVAEEDHTRGCVGIRCETIDNGHHYISVCDAPAFTRSLNAALTLVPEGLNASVKCYSDGCGAAEIWRVAPELFADIPGGFSNDELRRRNGSFVHQNVGAATPALALCIAALKALAAWRKATER